MKGSIANAAVATVVATLSLLACDPESDRPPPPVTASTFPPEPIATLRSLNIGSIDFTLAVNGESLPERWLAGERMTTVTLAPSLLNRPLNDVTVEFFFETSSGDRLPIARATERLPSAGSGETLSLSGLFFIYTDSDADGLFDVHELAAPVPDVDEDGRDAFEDADSDGDGLDDGVDPTPYGGTEGVEGALFTVQLSRDGGPDEIIVIERVIGATEELRQVVEQASSLELRRPAGWPVMLVPALGDAVWTAYDVASFVRADCPDWRIVADVTSFMSSLTAVSLMVFRDEDGTTFAAPISGDTVSDLDEYEHPGPRDGDGPWNDSLRVVLVPRHAAGWLELWSGRDFGGDRCAVNLATPASVTASGQRGGWNR